MYVVCVCEYRLPEAHCCELTVTIDSTPFGKLSVSPGRDRHICFCFLESSCLVGGRVLREFSWVAVVWCSTERIMWPAQHKSGIRRKHWIYVTWVQSSIVNTRSSVACATSKAHNNRTRKTSAVQREIPVRILSAYCSTAYWTGSPTRSEFTARYKYSVRSRDQLAYC